MITPTRLPAMNDDVARELAAGIAPTIEAVITDWHFIDHVLSDEPNTPLVKLLRFFAEPTRRPTAVDAIDDTEADEVIDLTVIDLRAIDLTTLLNELETIDFSQR